MTVWLNRAGTGDTLEFEELFLKEKIIAIDWREIKEDLTNINDKEELREIFIKTYTKHIYRQMCINRKKTYSDRGYNCYVGNSIGQIWRFLTEMKKGDIVLVPLRNRKIMVAEIVGDYKWIDEIPRHRRDIKVIDDISVDDYLKHTDKKSLYSGTVARLKDKNGKYLSNERILNLMRRTK